MPGHEFTSIPAVRYTLSHVSAVPVPVCVQQKLPSCNKYVVFCNSCRLADETLAAGLVPKRAVKAGEISSAMSLFSHTGDFPWKVTIYRDALSFLRNSVASHTFPALLVS